MDFAILGNKNILVFIISRSGKNVSWGIDLISQQGKVLKAAAEYPIYQLPRPKGRTLGGGRAVPFLHFSPAEKGFGVFGYSAEYKIFVTDTSGNIAMRIEKDEVPEPLTKKEKDAGIDDFLKWQGTGESGARLTRGDLEKVFDAMPKYNPYFASLITDDLGNIFVFRPALYGSQDQRPRYDFFDNSGRFLYRIKSATLGGPIKNGHVYSTALVGDSGYIRMRRLRIKNWDKLKESPN